MAKDLKLVLLLDCYGTLLTDRQRQMIQLYYDEDLSLGEIALPKRQSSRIWYGSNVQRGRRSYRMASNCSSGQRIWNRKQQTAFHKKEATAYGI